MGALDKLMFWKKQDSFDFDDFDKPSSPINQDPLNTSQGQMPLSENVGLPSDNTPDTFQSRSSNSFGQNPVSENVPVYNLDRQRPDAFSQNSANQGNIQLNREVELLNSKLDTIKAILASLDQRVGVIEQIARQEQMQQQMQQQNQRPPNQLW